MFGLGLVCLIFARSLVLFCFFREGVWDAWRTKVAGDLSSRAGFGAVGIWTFVVP